MKLLLIRHGEAIDPGPDVSDGSRWLTARGRDLTAVSAKHLRAHPPGAIVTSPLVRAVQTAELIAAQAPPPDPITVLPALATGDVAAIVRYIGRWKGDGALTLVGHEPTLSQVLVALIHPPDWPGFEKSAVVSLVRKGQEWSFHWMFLPKSSTTVDHLPG